MDLYNGDRYNFAYLIGEQWFDLISKLSEEKLNNLKRDINGKTLIGEYIGNQDY